MIRRPPRSTQGVSSAASDVYKRQIACAHQGKIIKVVDGTLKGQIASTERGINGEGFLSLIHISEPTRPY